MPAFKQVRSRRSNPARRGRHPVPGVDNASQSLRRNGPLSAWRQPDFRFASEPECHNHGGHSKGPVPSEDRLVAVPLETADRWSASDPKQNAWTETPSLPFWCCTFHAEARRRDDSLQQVVVLQERYCPAQSSRDSPNRVSRCVSGSVHVGFFFLSCALGL